MQKSWGIKRERRSPKIQILQTSFMDNPVPTGPHYEEILLTSHESGPLAALVMSVGSKKVGLPEP